mmetsp:Transcript_15172/g.37973  ORF Transcript_15172/g.37973 Transcript_15172/m.37973 type:complete len:259 (+) Transcript_15172:636-1412(+)
MGMWTVQSSLHPCLQIVQHLQTSVRLNTVTGCSGHSHLNFCGKSVCNLPLDLLLLFFTGRRAHARRTRLCHLHHHITHMLLQMVDRHVRLHFHSCCDDHCEVQRLLFSWRGGGSLRAAVRFGDGCHRPIRRRLWRRSNVWLGLWNAGRCVRRLGRGGVDTDRRRSRWWRSRCGDVDALRRRWRLTAQVVILLHIVEATLLWQSILGLTLLDVGFWADVAAAREHLRDVAEPRLPTWLGGALLHRGVGRAFLHRGVSHT